MTGSRLGGVMQGAWVLASTQMCLPPRSSMLLTVLRFSSGGVGMNIAPIGLTSLRGMFELAEMIGHTCLGRAEHRRYVT